jgi:hypothetical protein
LPVALAAAESVLQDSLNELSSAETNKPESRLYFKPVGFIENSQASLKKTQFVSFSNNGLVLYTCDAFGGLRFVANLFVF